MNLDRVRARPVRVTRTSLAAPAEVAHQVWDDELPWQHAVEELVDVLVAEAELVNLAVVERHPNLMATWHAVGCHWNPLPHVEGHEVRAAFHLLGSYVHDARGIMLLTDAHLARAHDLSGWDVEQVGPRRHLMRARDLAPWRLPRSSGAGARADGSGGHAAHPGRPRPRASRALLMRSAADPPYSMVTRSRNAPSSPPSAVMPTARRAPRSGTSSPGTNISISRARSA